MVRTPEGEVVLDTTGKRSGRGAYVCPDVSCLRKAREQGRLDKSLTVSISTPTWQQLEEACLAWQATGQAKR